VSKHYVHLSLRKRSDGYTGGVEKFASHLALAVPDLAIYSWSDYPENSHMESAPDWEKAEALGHWLLDEGLVGQDTTVIADGYWGLGVVGKVARLIVVCHGTYWGMAIQNEINPWMRTEDIVPHAQMQDEAYRAADLVVAVAPQSACELRLCGIESAKVKIILNGVGTEVFAPALEPPEDKVVLHVAHDPRKGKAMIPLVADRLARWDGPAVNLEYLGVHTANENDEAARWQEGCAAFFPSHYEGNSYALIEAMACNLPIVAYRTGLAADLPLECGIVVDDYHEIAFERALDRVLHGREFMPRAWVLANCTLAHFLREWKEVLR